MQKISLITLLFFIAMGCQQETERSMPPTHDNMNEHTREANEITKAICVLHPTEGNKVTGLVTFTKEGDNIKVVADIQNLKPGSHGFHIHQYGDCSAPDASSEIGRASCRERV